MTELNHEEMDQYRRHLSLQGFGEKRQIKLKKSSVLVVGAGGLGCPVLQYLTAAGVGKIGIVDDDVVESSNLQRQILFDHNDIGSPKAKIAASKLNLLNPFILHCPHVERLTKENAQSLFSEYDLIVDGTDNFSTRYLINDACILFEKPLIHGSINQFDGMVSVFNFNNGPTYRCLFPEQPDTSSIPSCAEAGVLGVLPGIIGSWQAMEVIKIITEIGEPLSGKVLMYNCLTHNTRTIKLQSLPESREIKKLPDPFEPCTIPLHQTSNTEQISEISEDELRKMIDEIKDLQILDVREDWERQQARIDSSLHQPLDDLIKPPIVSAHKDLIPEKSLIIYCKAGVRSRMACEALQSIGFSRLYNLSRGMDGWMQAYPEFTRSG
ncbi:MAG: HesA/MoeB/ThiF family protein [Opitutales bacterium]|nr:HesA/MoeB/ThiF family protein [Opitutales bacterium]